MEAEETDSSRMRPELVEFLVELSVSLHKYSMYPDGHPSLAPAVESLVRRADRLLDTERSISIARQQLIVDGTATDADHPVLRRLAEGLHRHHIGAVTLSRGVQASEVGQALQVLASDAERDGPVGLRRGDDAPNWPHVTLHPLSFDGLALAADDPLSDGADDGSAHARGAELWASLARAALSSDPPADLGAAPAEAADLARAINDHPRGAAYDRSIAHYLSQLAHELRMAGGEELRTSASTLIARLKPDVLRLLVQIGSEAGGRGQFVFDVAHALAADAVLEVVKAASEATGHSISLGLTRILTRLAILSQGGPEVVRSRADTEFRGQIGSLLQAWGLEDAAAGRSPATVAPAVSRPVPAHDPVTAAGIAAQPRPLRMIQLSLEAGRFGPLVERAIDEAVRQGESTSVIETLSSTPPGAEQVGSAVLARLIRPETLSAILSSDEVDLTGLDSLIPHLPASGYGPLLDALGASPSRTVRRRLLDRLSQVELDITPLVIARLDDERWYVQRNMLMLLQHARHVPEDFSVSRWTRHPDARVRYEAVRAQLALPRDRDLGLRTALADTDPRVVRLGLTTLPDDSGVALLDRVASLATDENASAEIRLLATNALARSGSVTALNGLLRLTDGGRTWLGRPKLPQKSPMLLAALRGLAERWSADPRAAAALAIARRSRDQELRASATRSSP